ncbi:MAG: hypothetical protein J6X55_16975 [Victivallales bacterium]|nr:hypothetical protein [Victivallales bacterium]
MACFTVPVGEAIVTTIIAKVMASKESKEDNGKTKFSKKLGWLNKLLWGGSALLAFEHIWHGEITPNFPFLTAVKNGETAEMLQEMATNGVGMALLVTIVWGGMVAISTIKEKNAENSAQLAEKAN